MSSRKRLVWGLVVVGLLAGAAILVWPPPARTVTISATAAPGTNVTGTYEVDGLASQVDTDAPTEIRVTGREVTCSLRNDGQPGEMSVRIATEDGWASATAGPNQGVNVGFRRRGNWLFRSEALWANTSMAAP